MPSCRKSGTKIGAKIAHFGMTPGMMSRGAQDDDDHPDEQRQGPDARPPRATRRGRSRARSAMLLKLKKAMNWLIISSMKTRPARPANVFVTAAMTSFAARERPRAPAVGHSRRRGRPWLMMNSRLSMNGVVADDVAGLGVAQRGARRDREHQDEGEEPEEAEQGVAQALLSRRRVGTSSASSSMAIRVSPAAPAGTCPGAARRCARSRPRRRSPGRSRRRRC